MRKEIKIITNDNKMFDSVADAVKHLEVTYGDKLTTIAHRILKNGKYTELCEFLDKHLDLFQELIDLKEEINNGIENED